jgi:hypothetical protein
MGIEMFGIEVIEFEGHGSQNLHWHQVIYPAILGVVECCGRPEVFRGIPQMLKHAPEVHAAQSCKARASRDVGKQVLSGTSSSWR